LENETEPSHLAKKPTDSTVPRTPGQYKTRKRHKGPDAVGRTMSPMPTTEMQSLDATCSLILVGARETKKCFRDVTWLVDPESIRTSDGLSGGAEIDATEAG
jgi:hypothetical protein